MTHHGITSYRKKIQEQVALEFGYEKDIIKEVLRQNSFKCSGDLVDFLFQLPDEENEKLQLAYFSRHEKEELEKRYMEEKMQRAEKEMDNVKLESLRKETKALYCNSMCLNCFTNQRNIVTLPCSHLCLCERCSEKVYKCPSCQEVISRIIKTFHC